MSSQPACTRDLFLLQCANLMQNKLDFFLNGKPLRRDDVFVIHITGAQKYNILCFPVSKLQNTTKIK